MCPRSDLNGKIGWVARFVPRSKTRKNMTKGCNNSEARFTSSARFYRNISVVFFLFGACGIGRAQENFTFDVHTLESHIEYEKSIGSEDEGTVRFDPYHDENYHDMLIEDQYPNISKKPRLFKRTNDEFVPSLKTWLFTDEDSLVKGIFYVWAIHNPSYDSKAQPTLLKDQLSRQEEYEAKFDEVFKALTGLLDKPDTFREGENDQGVVREFIWDRAAFRTTLDFRFDKVLQEIPFGEGSEYGVFRIAITTIFKERMK